MIEPDTQPAEVPDTRPRRAAETAARRRGTALALTWIVPAFLTVGGFEHAWPLFCIPLVFAMPLAGMRGFSLTAAGTALVMAMLTASPRVDGVEVLMGLIAFSGAGFVAGLAQQAATKRVESAERHSITDRLTGLANYAYFEDALRRECRRADRYGTPLSVVLLDLDRFKVFNDRHGHESGNRLLADVGEVIQSSLRSTDIAARYGGEELAVIVQGTVREAEDVAERIRQKVARLRVEGAGGVTAGTTVSAGVAEYVPGRGDGDLMVDQADKALYAAKDAGRDRVQVFEPEHRWARVGVA